MRICAKIQLDVPSKLKRNTNRSCHQSQVVSTDNNEATAARAQRFEGSRAAAMGLDERSERAMPTVSMR